MKNLAEMDCVPCKGGTPKLQGGQLQSYLKQLDQAWRVVEQHHLEREYQFPDFRKALDFTNRVGELAEAQGHHPDIYLAWGQVRLVIYTHSAGGLTESDFVFAAKVDQLQTGGA